MRLLSDQLSDGLQKAAVLLGILASGTLSRAELVFETQDLFVGGTGGYHTYRIPALAQTPDGVLYAFAEARKNSPSDSGDIDLVMRRSSDNGITWSKMEKIFDDGGNTMGQPTPIVNQETGQLMLMFAKNNREAYVSRYHDDAQGFGAPVDITAIVKSLETPFEINRVGPGPTAGVQAESGRLIAPVWVNGTIGVPTTYRVGVLYSDDEGDSWHAGGTVDVNAQIAGVNESTIVVQPDGSLYMTQRTNAGAPMRSFSVSEDEGLTWTAAQTLPQIDPDMTAIKAGLTRIHERGVADTTGLLFSAPEGPGRSNMAVWWSPDSQTWSKVSQVKSGPSGYSELAQLQDGFVGLLYEGGQTQYYERLSFARLKISSDTLTAWNGIEGDVDQDGEITLADAQAFVDAWDRSARYWGGAESYTHGDLNFDGRTDWNDVHLLRGYLNDAGVSAGSLAALAVPEPATQTMTVIGLMVVAKIIRDFHNGSLKHERSQAELYEAGIPMAESAELQP